MSTRDLSNKRIGLWLGFANAVADIQAPTIAEINAMKLITEAVRWDGWDFGVQESEQTDDRSLADDAGATIRGFAQFGGALPVYYPKVTDTGSILRQTFNMVKVPRTELLVIERIGFKDFSEPIAAGDNVNVYRVLSDGFNPDTEGDGGYAYILNLLPKGDVAPWTIVPSDTPTKVAITGATAATLAPGAVALRGATYFDNNITSRARWTSSDGTKVRVSGGVIQGLAVGTANIVATFPGGAASDPVAITVAAA